jgi:hypothetical protein
MQSTSAIIICSYQLCAFNTSNPSLKCNLTPLQHWDKSLNHEVSPHASHHLPVGQPSGQLPECFQLPSQYLLAGKHTKRQHFPNRLFTLKTNGTDTYFLIMTKIFLESYFVRLSQQVAWSNHAAISLLTCLLPCVSLYADTPRNV